jgi:hypothetical protein
MAEEKMALLDVLRKGEEPDGDVLVEGLRWLLQELMDAEVSAQIGAGHHMSAAVSGRRSATGIAAGRGIRVWAHSTWPSRSCVRVVTFRVGWSHVDEPSRH